MFCSRTQHSTSSEFRTRDPLTPSLTLYQLSHHTLISSQSSGEVSMLIWIHCVDEKSMDSDQLATSEASLSGFILFFKIGYRILKE